MASIPWPEDLCSGVAHWWLGYMAADTDEDDDRYPQLKAGAGIRVNFSPDVNQAVRYSGVEGNKTIMPLVSTGVIDDEGYLCTENEDGSAGDRGVVLPSSECESLTPQDWTWTVTVTENRIRINRFSISLSPGETIDLADYAPVDSSGGTHIVTETETAERAEKAASQASQFRQETQTDREATQRLRNEAETFRDEAGESATSSAQSASTAADILAASQALGITVDTSVGTRIFVGDTMIHGDTGWREVSGLLRDGWSVESGNRFIEMRRENSTVYVRAWLENTSTSENSYILLFPMGFRPLKYGVLGNARLDGTSTGIAIANGSTSRLEVFPGVPAGSPYVQVLAVFSTPQDWPTSLPGLPA